MLPDHCAGNADFFGQLFPGEKTGSGQSEKVKNFVFIHSKPGDRVSGKDAENDPAAVFFLQPLNTGRESRHFIFMLISAAEAECVRLPQEIKSTPVSAMPLIVSSVTLPEASISA